MDDIVKRARDHAGMLGKPEHNEETMRWWDKLRARIKASNGSGPRDDFENFLDVIDEDRRATAVLLTELAEEVERLRAELVKYHAQDEFFAAIADIANGDVDLEELEVEQSRALTGEQGDK